MSTSRKAHRVRCSRRFSSTRALFVTERSIGRSSSESPARKLKARSRKRVCNQTHTLEECDAFIAELSGRDRLIIKLLMQLGLRSEELFVLRRNDVLGTVLVIDEAIVRGRLKGTKTEESNAVMYIPPN